MSDNLEFRSLAKEAYPVESLDGAARDRIAQKAGTVAAHPVRRRPWGRYVLVSGLAIAALAAYPIVDKNLTCYQIAQNLAPKTPYRIRLRLRMDGTLPFGTGIDAVMCNGEVMGTDGAGAMFDTDRHEQNRTIDPDGNAIIKSHMPGSTGFFQIPMLIAAGLGQLGVHKDFVRLSDTVDDGHRVQRYKFSCTFIGATSGEIHIDASTGLPRRVLMFTPNEGGKPFASTEIDLDYDAQAMWDRYRAAFSVAGREVEMGDPDLVGKALAAHPVVSKAFGKDKLTIYRYERLPDGVLLVLYTITGPSDETALNFVRARDRASHNWLPVFIDYSFGLKLDGRKPHAAALFPPEGWKGDPVTLFVDRKDGQFCFQSPRQPEVETKGVPSIVTSAAPTEAPGVPGWFYFNFPRFLWGKYRNFGTFLELQDALDRGLTDGLIDRLLAVRQRIKDDPNPFFIRVTDVDATLSRAYLALHQPEKAKRFMKEAVPSLDDGTTYGRSEREISEGKKRFGL